MIFIVIKMTVKALKQRFFYLDVIQILMHDKFYLAHYQAFCLFLSLTSRTGRGAVFIETQKVT